MEFRVMGSRILNNCKVPLAFFIVELIFHTHSKWRIPDVSTFPH